FAGRVAHDWHRAHFGGDASGRARGKQAVRSGRPADVLRGHRSVQDLTTQRPCDAAYRRIRPVIEVENLVKQFNGTTAVAGISFRVGEGEIFGLLGPNGAGKSTTLKILSTLLSPTSGSARVAEHDVMREPAAVRASLGMLFQDQALDDRLTARETLLVHAMIYDVPRRDRAQRIGEALEWIGLSEQAGDLVRTFSGGMRRRLEVSRALLHRPRVLFLDEPTTGLDPQTRRALWEKLHELRA